MLRQKGYDSECVENGLEAVVITEKKEYDLILMVSTLLYPHPLLFHLSFQGLPRAFTRVFRFLSCLQQILCIAIAENA